MENKIILNLIKKEIEEKYECEVITIRETECLGTPNVNFKIKFNEDFLYRNEIFRDMPYPEYVCFSEKTMMFQKRTDLFECMKEYASFN